MSETDEPMTIRWMAGVTRIARETRVEGKSLVFGFRINGGEFQRTGAMTFERPSDLAEAASVAAKLA